MGEILGQPAKINTRDTIYVRGDIVGALVNALDDIKDINPRRDPGDVTVEAEAALRKYCRYMADLPKEKR